MLSLVSQTGAYRFYAYFKRKKAVPPSRCRVAGDCKSKERAEEGEEMTEKERMLAGKLYIADDKELAKDSETFQKVDKTVKPVYGEDSKLRIQLIRNCSKSRREVYG